VFGAHIKNSTQTLKTDPKPFAKVALAKIVAYIFVHFFVFIFLFYFLDKAASQLQKHMAAKRPKKATYLA